MFPSKVARNNHRYIAHKDNNCQLNFKCKECNIFFEMKEELRIHSFIHFNGEIKTCLECDQIFKTNRLLKIHMQKHESQKSFECTVCGDFFTFKTGLAKHIRLNRCKGPIIHYNINDECEKEEDIVALAQKQLDEMSKPSNKKKAASLKQVEMSSSIDSASDNENIFDALSPELEPDLCKEEVNIEDMIIEIKETRKSSRRKVDETMKVDLGKLEVKIEDIKIETRETRKSRKRKIQQMIKPRQGRAHLVYTCDYCGEDIKFKKEILSHMKSHTVTKNYKCKECPCTFKSRTKTIAHSVEIHGIKPSTVAETFCCEICDKKFDVRSIYEAHKLSHDDNARSYICVLCSAAFKSIGNLNRHEATHNLSRNFECLEDYCKKRFKTKLALKIHNETVHPQVKVFVNCHICDAIIQEKYVKVHVKNQHTEEGKEKPFCCTICYKTFKTEKLGQRHYESVHDPKSQGRIYTCPQCPDLQFFRQRDLKHHSILKHFEGTIFQCETCLKLFTNKRLLSIHGAVHNGTGNFACKHCTNVVFKTRGGRRKHMMRVHKEETQSV